MPLLPWVTVSTGLFFVGASLLVGLLAVAWQLGAVANGANRFADNVATLNGQLRTITDGVEGERSSSVPEDIKEPSDAEPP